MTGNSTLGNSASDVNTIRGNAVFTDQTASTLAIFNASKQLVSSTVTLTNLTDLTDGGDSTLHYHATDRARANHTGTQTASTISDFSAAVQASFGEAHIGTWSVSMFGDAARMGQKDFNLVSNWGFVQFKTSGNVAIAGPTINLYGATTLNGSLSVTGDCTWGDSATDAIVFNGRLDSDFIPLTNNARTIASSSLRLANIYSVLGNFSGELTGTTATMTGDVIGGSVARSGALSGYPTLAEFNHKDSTAFGFVCGADGARTIGGSTFDLNTSGKQKFLLGGASKLDIDSTAITASVPINGTSMTMSGDCTLGDAGTDSHIINGDLSTNAGALWTHNGNLRLKRATTGEGSYLLFGDDTYSAFKIGRASCRERV
jgi:hypothetical protein